MDRETRRTIEEFRREAGPLENNVIDELVGGELDRQEFLRRATMFGLGAGTIGALLRFMGEPELAFGAPLEAVQAGGTIRLGIPVFGASLEPYLLNEGPVARVLGHSGRVPDLHDTRRPSRALARIELQAERRRDRVDLPDPARASSSTTARHSPPRTSLRV